MDQSWKIHFLPYYLELIKYISNYDDSLFNSFEI